MINFVNGNFLVNFTVCQISLLSRIVSVNFDTGKFHSEFHGVANFTKVKLNTVDFVD